MILTRDVGLAALKPLELLYRGLNRTRRALYRRGILKAKRLAKPVISVGNTSMGGAGKTPAVIAIARFLVGRGHKVTILTRGYGRIGAGGEVVQLDAERYGDEPVLIKKSTTFTTVIVGSNRYESGRAINCDVYLLDDGFQHLQLHRDLDIVIDNPGKRLRREGDSALNDAHFIITRRLKLLLPVGLTAGSKVFLFSGLADNDQFFESVKKEGVEVVGTLSFPDHHRYTPSDIADIRRSASARGASLIMTTEKDQVKLGDAPDILAVRADMLIDDAVLQAIAAVVER